MQQKQIDQTEALAAFDRYVWFIGRPHHPDALIVRKFIEQYAREQNHDEQTDATKT